MTLTLMNCRSLAPQHVLYCYMYCRFHFVSNMRIACQVLRQELPVGGALWKSHGSQYAGVRKLRALCVSVIFAEHSFRENPRKYACSKRIEIDSSYEQWPCSKNSQVWHDCRVVTIQYTCQSSGGAGRCMSLYRFSVQCNQAGLAL